MASALRSHGLSGCAFHGFRERNVAESLFVTVVNSFIFAILTNWGPCLLYDLVAFIYCISMSKSSWNTTKILCDWKTKHPGNGISNTSKNPEYLPSNVDILMYVARDQKTFSLKKHEKKLVECESGNQTCGTHPSWNPFWHFPKTTPAKCGDLFEATTGDNLFML